MTWRSSAGSRPEVGSSRISSDGAGQQLQRHRRALALAAGELVDPGLEMLGHLEFLEHLHDDLFAVGLRGVGRQPQFGGEHQRLPDGQLAVHDVVLRHHPDSGAQRGVLGVHVVTLEGHRARRRMRVAGHQLRKGRLARARRADDGGQRAGARRDRDVVQQRLVALDRPRDAVHLEAAGAGGGVGLGAAGQRAAREHQVDVADRDGVAVAQHRRVDARAVDERAVDAAVVADLGSAGRGHQGRVMTRRQHVGDDDVVVGGAADLDGARGARCGGSARPQDLQHARREVALARARGGRRAHRRHRLQCRRRHRLRHRRLPRRCRGAGRIRRRAALGGRSAAPTGTAAAARTGTPAGAGCGREPPGGGICGRDARRLAWDDGPCVGQGVGAGRAAR